MPASNSVSLTKNLEATAPHRRSTEENTPASLGYRMPAEWEPHEATWIGWPHNRTDWPGKLAPIHWVYGEIVRKIVPGELVRILVNSTAHEAQARQVLKSAGVSLGRVQFLRFPTNRGWTRDFGPIFVKRAKPGREVAIARFRFNAWARYPDWKKDDAIPAASRAPIENEDLPRPYSANVTWFSKAEAST